MTPKRHQGSGQRDRRSGPSSIAQNRCGPVLGPSEPSPRAEPRAHVLVEALEQAPKVQAQPAELDSSVRSLKAPLAGLATLAVAGLAAVVYFKEPPPAAPTAPAPPPREAMRAALMVASQGAHVANGYAMLRKQTVEQLETTVAKALDKSNYGDALQTTVELRRRQPENLKFVRLRHQALIGAREYADARSELIDATVVIGGAQELTTLFVQAVQEDPTLRDVVVTIGNDEKVDKIKALGGGRSISFKLKRDGAYAFAFKPAQAEWEERWRAEVAAWRLCQVVACEFTIPRSRTGRVSRADFEALYPMDPGKQTRYAERFPDLWWKTTPQGDEYLYGVLKDWVPHFTDFPIEYTHIWEDWLDATGDPAVLDKPLKAAIRGLYVYGGGAYYRKILRERRGASTRQVARQLSNILVFDYLTNNWDRFSALEEYYGVNNQFADGGFVSIDNGACFHEQSSARVDARFEPVERVSRRMIASLTLLDPVWLNALLFPEASEEEQQRLDVFWARRDQVLARIEDLKRRHGEEKIYVFK